MDSVEHYEQKKARLQQQMKAAGNSIGLAKETSNLFRSKEQQAATKLSVKDFTNLLEVNKEEGWFEVEGMMTFADLVDSLLPHGLMPPVVPQLKSITIGGAVAGGGIEASSFKYGYVHETVLTIDILLSNGDVITATPDNEHRDLFFGLANSYGTLGYILKLRVKAIPVKPYVQLRHQKFTNAPTYFAALAAACHQAENDFVDGSIFNSESFFLTTGRFVGEAPYTSDYTFENIFYKSIKNRTEDYLTTKDFIWRWDTDWFWCSRFLGAEQPLIRRLLGKKRLNSIFYTKMMRWNRRWKISATLDRIRGVHHEAVIQDVEIPITNAISFLEFFQKEIGIFPIWTCPARAFNADNEYPLFRTDRRQMYINFGFWDSVKSKTRRPVGYYNKKVEAAVEEFAGMKSLYSDVFYDEPTFWRLYNRPAYDRLKQTYDQAGKLPDLYTQTIDYSRVL